MNAQAPRIGFGDAADRGGATWNDAVQSEHLEQLTSRPIVREIELG